MLKRKFYDKLLAWKNKSNKTSLLVRGARQVGKTFIIRQFGENEYDNLIEINFFTNPVYKEIFSGALDANTIYEQISLRVPGAVFTNNTLLFLDEIQHCPEARTALKFLVEDNRCDVIASGSLLGLHYKDIISIPVGYEEQMDMYSLDFEEYLWALGYENAVPILKKHFSELTPLDEAINQKYLDLFRSYLAVGGMPAVVNRFVETHNYQMVHEVQNAILREYRADIEKYARGVEKQKVSRCFDSIPAQLAKEFTRFQYSKVEKGATSKKYESSVNWLVDAGIVSQICNVSFPEIPLAAYRLDNEFKIYMTDIGLLTCMYGFETQSLLVRNELKGTAKGGIYENLIFSALVRNGYKVYYYRKSGSEQEIEFMIEKNGSAIPIEVKSKNGATLSLNSLIKNHHPKYAYKLIDGNIGTDGIKRTIPQYMAIFV